MLHGDHEWRCGSAALGLGCKGQFLGVIWDKHANEEHTEDVEDNDSPEGQLDSFRDGLAGVLGLADSDTNKFGTCLIVRIHVARVCSLVALTEKRKGSLHHGGPECKELSKVTFNIFVIESARGLPVSESSSIVIGATSKCEDERAKNDSQDDNDLESRQPELQFTKDFHAEIVDHDNGHHEYGNPYTRVNIVCGYSGPVCDDQCGCGELRGRKNDIFEIITGKNQYSCHCPRVKLGGFVESRGYLGVAPICASLRTLFLHSPPSESKTKSRIAKSTSVTGEAG